MSSNEINRKKIVHSLSLIRQLNFMDIEKMLVPYLFNNVDTCKLLINQIIKES